ncbi:MAG TPA: PIN domain-containing protein [Candidatus Limnocylindria bacterium]
MAAVLLDTTVIIDLLRGRADARRRLTQLHGSGDSPYVCAINVEETVRGLTPSERDVARALFSGLRIVPLTDVEGWRAGEWRRSYASRGTTLAQADCLIAAAAVAIGGRLATGNPRDFPMAELVVEHWPVGA